MGRNPKYTEDEFLDAALQLVAEQGIAAATVGAVARRLGAPTGSVYHRFASRDLLLARLWLRTVRRFQSGFLQALTGDVPDTAAAGAALHVVGWVREHLDEARVLLLYRREDLVTRWPDVLGEDLATLNDGVTAALHTYARHRYGRADKDAVRRVTFAMVDIPQAAVLRHLRAGDPPPPMLDQLVTASCLCALTTPDAQRQHHAP